MSTPTALTSQANREGPPSVTSDADRFSALFHATYEDLLRFTERRLHPLAAEDVVAQVFLIAWRRLEQAPADHDGARAWLFTIANHTIANQRRSESRRDRLTSRIGTHLPPEAAVPDGSEHVIARLDLARAWAQLGSGDQEVLTLVVLDQVSGTQAAAVLGISRAALSVRVLRARRRLRTQLGHLARRPSTNLTGPTGSASHENGDPR